MYSDNAILECSAMTSVKKKIKKAELIDENALTEQSNNQNISSPNLKLNILHNICWCFFLRIVFSNIVMSVSISINCDSEFFMHFT